MTYRPHVKVLNLIFETVLSGNLVSFVVLSPSVSLCITLKGADKGKAVLSADGPTELELVGGEACEIMIGAEGLSGYYGTYEIDGARNFFASKDKSEVAAANGILAKWQGSFMVIWDGGSLSVSVAAKGKVKVAGTLINGTKVTANTVLLVGEEWSCISVAAQKANLAFALWLSHDGKTIETEGLNGDVHVGLPGTLANGATFHIDADEFAAVFGQTIFKSDLLLFRSQVKGWVGLL